MVSFFKLHYWFSIYSKFSDIFPLWWYYSLSTNPMKTPTPKKWVDSSTKCWLVKSWSLFLCATNLLPELISSRPHMHRSAAGNITSNLWLNIVSNNSTIYNCLIYVCAKRPLSYFLIGCIYVLFACDLFLKVYFFIWNQLAWLMDSLMVLVFEWDYLTKTRYRILPSFYSIEWHLNIPCSCAIFCICCKMKMSVATHLQTRQRSTRPDLSCQLDQHHLPSALTRTNSSWQIASIHTQVNTTDFV